MFMSFFVENSLSIEVQVLWATQNFFCLHSQGVLIKPHIFIEHIYIIKSSK